ncbi:uncharacterized protein LOC135195726 [Macrobrachium nipponense]|uniref:uncharacterized protein LOC135195726 n=1 Tax=Macrobrachium nipponense TaxID=159736 RepID=UPI0030C8B4C1
MSVDDELHRAGSAQQDRRGGETRAAKRAGAASKKGLPRFFWPQILGGGGASTTTKRNDVSHGTTNNSHPFVIRVEEANLQNAAAFTKVNATVLEDIAQGGGGAAAPGGRRSLPWRKQEAEGKKKREKVLSKPFTFFHFCKKRDQKTLVFDYKGTAPPSSPESFGAAVEERTHNHLLFRPVPVADVKRNGELPSLNILTSAVAPTLPPSFHNYDEPAEQESKDLSSLYDLVSIQERGGVGVGDFTSVDFDVESYGEGDNISVYESRPATKESCFWSSSGASVHLAGRSITAGIRPVLHLPPLERVLSVSDALLDGAQDGLENWMSRLHPEIRKIPLNHLFIPGSHDAFSFSLTEGEDVGPDAPHVVANLDSCCSCMARPAILRWSVTQKASVADQLKHGIRYFDIRVAVRDSRFFFVHGLYGGDLEPLLCEISHFLVRHPGEVVLLDFQHFHGLSSNDHAALIALLKATFSDLLCPFFQQLKHLTLSYLARYKYQVLVFYRHDQSMQAVSWLWSSDSIPNPWPDTTSVTKMISFLEKRLKDRDPHTFFVTQCILTPSGKYLLRHFAGMLEKKMAAPCNRVVGAWVGHLPHGAQGPNIVMTDFVEFDDWAVPRAVIKRNTSPQLTPSSLQRY